MSKNFTEPKLRELLKDEVRIYFETWLSLQPPRRLKQMDDAEVYRNAFILDTWLQNNSRKRNLGRDKHGKFISLEELATLRMQNCRDDPDGMRNYVAECEKDISEEDKTDLSNDVDELVKLIGVGLEIAN